MDLRSTARTYDGMIFDEIQRRYFGTSSYFNAGYWEPATEDQGQASQQLLDRLIRGGPESPRRVLDVGCGLGAGTRHLQEIWPTAQVTALNISESQLRETRRNAPQARLAAMDASQLGIATSTIDVLASVEAALHFPSRRAFLAEAARVLRPGGYLR